MRDLLEYGAIRAFQAGLATLPRWGARSLAEVLGRVAHATGLRRDVVYRQLAASFPERPREWVRETALKCYRHYSRELVAIARRGGAGPEELAARTAGTERFTALLEEHLEPDRGVVVVTGHLGNWELAGAVPAGLGFPVAAVVKQQVNPRVDRYLSRVRGGLRMETIYMEEAPRRVPAALEEGKVVALVADQNAMHRGVFVPFLGRLASTFRGPAAFALKHDVPLLFGGFVREKSGYRIFLEPVDRAGLAGEGADARYPGPGTAEQKELTARWVTHLERAVRWWPQQYFWFHRRWKSRPEDAGHEPPPSPPEPPPEGAAPGPPPAVRPDAPRPAGDG